MNPKPKLNVRLLRRIQKQILAEPRQFFMSWWFTSDPDDVMSKKIPNCGTAACIGGWAVALSKKMKPERARIFHGGGIGPLATSLIGLDPAFADRLFVASWWPMQFRSKWRVASTPLARAKVAAARIEHLIKTGE